MAEDLAPILIKKIKKGGHGHHGGAWKLAYADFVTAMMAFFLVMWIIGLDFKTKSGLAEYFQNPGAFKINFKSSPYMLQLDGKPPGKMGEVGQTSREQHNVDLEGAEGLASLINSAIKNEPRVRELARRTDVKITPDGLNIELGEAASGVFFAAQGKELKVEANRLLQAIAPVLIGSRKKVEIDSHTDAAPLTDLSYTKWELSADRGNAVRRALSAVGLPQDQIVSVNAKADRMLKRTDNARAVENNRVIIRIPITTTVAQ